ncbi:MAG: hypothetical protein J6K05_04610 [Bacteroidaceae bacterium]|nr:hypothetical protein [Bacteroidaceae bacterium]
MKKSSFLTLIILLFSSCITPYIISRPFENTWYGNPHLKKFTFRKQQDYPQLSSLLNVDGYYWGEVKDTVDTTIFTLLLYRDGSIATYTFHNRVKDTTKFVTQTVENTKVRDTCTTYIKKEIEKEISSESMRLSWGRFYLYGDTIKGQEFYTYGGGLGHLFPIEYHLIENKFLILNKSQIILLKSKNSRNISFNHHDTLNFEPYSNRRDSTFFFKNKRWFNKFNLFYTKKMKEIKPF